jgi:hypothetical protein
MNCNNATKSNRKSGVAQWRDLLFIIRISNLNESAPLPFVIPSINRKALSRAEECVELR